MGGTEHGCLLGHPAPNPGGQYGNFLVAANETAIALANRGNEVVFVYGQNACHTDEKIYRMEGANAIIWAWSEWKKIVSTNETTPTSTAPTSTDASAAVRTFNGIWFTVGIIVATTICACCVGACYWWKRGSNTKRGLCVNSESEDDDSGS